MKSRITIDFRGVSLADSDINATVSGFEPIIKVIIEDSEDVRDGLMKSFFEQLGSESNWLSVDMNEQDLFGKNKKYITIAPIRPGGELQETLDQIKSRFLPLKKIENEGYLPSRFQIGDSTDYTTSQWIDEAFQKAKKKNDKLKSPLLEEDLDYIPHYSYGKVVAVKFTEGKVWYNVIDDFTGLIMDNIDSSYCKHFSDTVRAELKQ